MSQIGTQTPLSAHDSPSPLQTPSQLPSSDIFNPLILQTLFIESLSAAFQTANLDIDGSLLSQMRLSLANKGDDEVCSFYESWMGRMRDVLNEEHSKLHKLIEGRRKVGIAECNLAFKQPEEDKREIPSPKQTKSILVRAEKQLSEDDDQDSCKTVAEDAECRHDLNNAAIFQQPNHQGQQLESSSAIEHSRVIKNDSMSEFIVEEDSYADTTSKNSASGEKDEKLLGFLEQETKTIPNQEDQSKDKDWRSHLETLSYAQTELSYLCQQMRWQCSFINGKLDGKQNLLFGRAVVKVLLGNDEDKEKIFEGYCKSAGSRKMANHHASILCLAQIYRDVQGAWREFSAQREEKPTLMMPHTADNREILKEVEQQKSKGRDEETKNLVPELLSYIGTVKKYKKELTFFVGQNNRMFMQPRWIISSSSTLGMWQVEGFVRYEMQDKFYEYRFRAMGRNKKQGEEKVAKQILLNIYRDFPRLFEKFKVTKLRKGLE